MIFIIKGFRTIVFIFSVISITFRPICPPAFSRCLSNSVTYTELRTTSFIQYTGVTCSDSVSHNRVQVLSIPALLFACSQDWTGNLQMIVSLEAYGASAYNCYAMCPASDPRGFNKGHSSKFLIGSRVRQTPEESRRTYRQKLTIKMKTIVQKSLMIKIIKLRLRNLDNWWYLTFHEKFEGSKPNII